MRQIGRYLGSFAHVPRMRPCWLLRFVEESPRPGAFSRHAAPDYPVCRARRRRARGGSGFAAPAGALPFQRSLSIEDSAERSALPPAVFSAVPGLAAAEPA